MTNERKNIHITTLNKTGAFADSYSYELDSSETVIESGFTLFDRDALELVYAGAAQELVKNVLVPISELEICSSNSLKPTEFQCRSDSPIFQLNCLCDSTIDASNCSQIERTLMYFLDHSHGIPVVGDVMRYNSLINDFVLDSVQDWLVGMMLRGEIAEDRALAFWNSFEIAKDNCPRVFWEDNTFEQHRIKLIN